MLPIPVRAGSLGPVDGGYWERTCAITASDPGVAQITTRVLPRE